ncbi:MAG: Gfo/Idh/MocA family oxidoreductase [Chitinophagaceae bacterium]
MEAIRWGIIGCGDVTEIKSGPALNKIENSSLVAVMRRDAAKAADYAQRHGVSKWYDDAYRIIEDPDVNAIYVATPPLSHEEYAVAALKAGKPVYLEKPMALQATSCRRIVEVANSTGIKLTVAHYRRALPLYIKVRELLESGVIGKILFVNCQVLQPFQSGIIAKTAVNWRTDPAISGGGLFHDLAPHHLDLMLYYFGVPKSASGYSANQRGFYKADDIVSGEILFDNEIIFKGLWCFTVPVEAAQDHCEIVGAEGIISFSFFGSECLVNKQGKEERFKFINPLHVQQPMLEKVVSYFQEKGPNPCSGEEASIVIETMDRFTL